MTRKEIENTPELVDFMLDRSVISESRMKLHKRLEELCKLAIKALEQQPCEDAISRRAVDMLVDELARAISDERCCISRGRSTATIMQDILDLPPVQPTVNCKNCVFRTGYGTGIDEGILNALPKKTKEGE